MQIFQPYIDNEDGVFTIDEVNHIATILRGAYDIRTCAGEKDDLLADFIDALDNVNNIQIVEDNVEPQEITEADRIH